MLSRVKTFKHNRQIFLVVNLSGRQSGDFAQIMLDLSPAEWLKLGGECICAAKEIMDGNDKEPGHE